VSAIKERTVVTLDHPTDVPMIFASSNTVTLAARALDAKSLKVKSRRSS
jgi:hypothetical protein